MGAILLGLAAGLISFLAATKLKKMMGYDDSLDVFGVHGVGGILGALLTGVFNAPQLGGPSFPVDWFSGTLTSADAYSIGAQVLVQAKAVGVTILWSGIVSAIAYKLVDLTIGLRVSEEEEREGLDISSHGETAYHK
jgi:Amt family ammonium transporter